MKLLKAMATVAGLTGVSRILGFIRDILTAAILGAGPVADAFFVALKLPNFFRRVTAEGAFSIAFVPIYSELISKEGEEKANIFASNALGIMMIFLVPFTILAIIFMPYIIYAIAPGFNDDPQRYALAVELSRITFPYLLLMSLTALLGGVMNAHDKFAPFAAAPIFFNGALIAALLWLTPFVETAGHALSYGIAAAGLLQFLWLVRAVMRQRIRITIKKPEYTQNIKKLFKLMTPAAIGAGVVHINLFADVIIASMLAGGSISYLYYADRLNQLPLGIVGIAVGTALLPMLSRSLANGNKAESQNLFNRALEVCLVLALPAAAALMVIPETLISTLFERGAFTPEDTIKTAHVLMGYALGLPAYIAVKVFSTAYWSQQDTLSPVKISILVTVLNICLALILIKPLGVAGIATATGIVGWLQLGLLYHGLRTHDTLRFDDRFKSVIFKILFSTLLMAVILLAADKYFSDMVADNQAAKALFLVTLIALSFFVYGVSVIKTGAIKMEDLKRYLTRGKKA